MPVIGSDDSPNRSENIDSNDKKPKSPIKPPLDIDDPPFYLPLKSIERYKTVGILGTGSFGRVTLGKSLQNLNDSSNFKPYINTLLQRDGNFKHENYFNKKVGLVAIKTMTNKLKLLNDYTNVKEIRFILSVPYHQNLVQVYEMFIDDTNYDLHISMECLDQNLYQLMKSRRYNFFSENTLKSILSQMLNGIRHIHKNNYFHRDIKPENILISPSNRFYDQEFINSKKFKFHDSFILKIADYGLSRHIDNKKPYTSYVSTRWYRAPEILLRNNYYSTPVDIWAFGSVASEVVTFRPLFPGSDELEQIWKVFEFLGTPYSKNNLKNYNPLYGYWDRVKILSQRLKLQFPIQRGIDISYIIPNPELKELCDVIRACLAWNPKTRANADTICAMPYFKGTCVDDYPTLPIPIPTTTAKHQTTQSLDYGDEMYLCGNVDNKMKIKNKTDNIFDLSKAEILAGIPSLEKTDDVSIFKTNSETELSDDSTQVDGFDDLVDNVDDNDDDDDENEDEDEDDKYANNDRVYGSRDNAETDDEDIIHENLSNFNNNVDRKKNYQNSNEQQLNFPNLITNDENYNTFGNDKIRESSKFKNSRLNAFKNVQLDDKANLNLMNYEASSRNKFGDLTNYDVFPIDQQYPQPVYISPDALSQKSYCSNSFQGFNEWTNGGDFAQDHQPIDSKFSTEELLHSTPSKFEGTSNMYTTTHASIQGIYPKDSYIQTQDSNEYEKNSAQRSVPTFTGELLSKFNLRRINPSESTSSFNGSQITDDQQFDSYS